MGEGKECNSPNDSVGKHASVRENQKKSEKRQKNVRTICSLNEETYFIPAHTRDLN